MPRKPPRGKKKKAETSAVTADTSQDPTSSAFVGELWQSLQANEVAVLCGAGISRSSGLPVVPELIGAILQRLKATPEESQAILESGLPFEAFVEILHDFSDIEPLLSIFEAGTPGSTHLLLAALAKAGHLRIICTTNFDSLIEQALEQLALRRELNFEVLYRDEDLGRVRAADDKIRVIKVHGSIDDKAGMAITLKQVASRTLTENRRQVIDTLFGGGTHARVLILGYSCSDVFDLSPHIESISATHRQVILIDHASSGWEVRSLGQREKKNPFRDFPGGQWVLSNTDQFLNRLQQLAGLKVPAAAAPSGGSGWQENVDQWFRVANEKNRSQAGPAILGEIFYKVSDYQKASAHYSRALAGARAAGDRQREGIYLGNVANSEQHLGHFAEATRAFEQALEISREIGDRQREAMWLSNLGGLFVQMRELDRGIEALQQAIVICRERGDVTGECYGLANLGSAFQLSGDYERATAYFEAALELARQLGDKQAETNVRDNLGQILYLFGQYTQALEHHKAAISTAMDLGDRAAVCNLEGQLAKSYSAIQDYERAMQHLDRAITLAQAIGDRYLEGNRLNELGIVHQARKSFDQAAKMHKRALELARGIGHPALEATILGNLGNVCNTEKKYEDAIAFYEQALAMAIQTDDKALQATWLSNIGATRYQLGHYAPALESQQRALELASAIGDTRQVGNSEYNLGSTQLALGDIEAAWQHFSHAFKAYRSIFGADHGLTQQAKASLDELTPLLPSIFCIQRPDGQTFDLQLANGKCVLPVFTSSATAIRVRDLVLERFGGPMQIAEVQVTREVFESTIRPEGVEPEDYLFIYEDSPSFPQLIASLEAFQPPS